MWRKYFKLVKLVPGRVITQTHGTIDFNGDVPVETCRELFEQDFPYLQITDEGKEKLYGIKTPSNYPSANGGEKEKKKKSSSSARKTTRKKRRSSTRTYKLRNTDTDS